MFWFSVQFGPEILLSKTNSTRHFYADTCVFMHVGYCSWTVIRRKFDSHASVKIHRVGDQLFIAERWTDVQNKTESRYLQLLCEGVLKCVMFVVGEYLFPKSEIRERNSVSPYYLFRVQLTS
jgi:hypothetical protein